MSRHLTGPEAEAFADAAERFAEHLVELVTAATLERPLTQAAWKAQIDVISECVVHLGLAAADMGTAALGEAFQGLWDQAAQNIGK